ncbi:conserved protein of unknown function (plasmid) [Rhodovastum atsumiense]|uniref:Uncharacterized protein n=1 Tax=Rhodovastum atsumiense TaxID=504468 RepID=A0A5M6IKJ6_9PROT|nr:hypothetical protein [Rhodovastum atsumiense]KAA5608078.1 hypothetical protein F1189_30775 [Rhodovastum atsumiense]CAH2606538.1 conserved protein of unknown function [Rhodovastum atsumiense]
MSAEARTRDQVRNEAEAAISGAVNAFKIVKVLAAESNGSNSVDDCALEWLAEKGLEEARAAFDLLEELDNLTRPARARPPG